MTLAGWIFMVGSITAVCGLTVFCYHRVLTHPEATDHMHAELEIDTGDLDDA